MKKLTILFVIFLSFSGFSQSKPDFTGFLKVDGKKIVDKNGKNVLLRGIGLGGHMLQEGYMLKVPFSGQQYVFREHVEELIGASKTDEFYDAWLNNHTQKQDIDSLKSWGFNSVRLPMHYNLYTLPLEEEPVKGEQTWLEKGFVMTDSLVKWCKANDMYLILDMHATPGGQGHDVNISDRDPAKPSLWENEANQEKLIALWKKLAQRYKDEPVVGAYDLINEPNWSFEEGKNKNGTEDSKNALIWQLQKKITEEIRKIDTKHIIIIEGNGWGNNYNGLIDLWDDNLVMSFHKYWTYNTTGSIQNFLDFRENLDIPIWLGESGENSNAWFADAIGLMEQNNIGWCWWPLKKMGHNNPLQIKMNSGYANILNYWKGEASKPSEEEAYEALMQLAENTKIENCILHHDVIDAMIRQTSSKKSIPFKNIRIENQGELKAANYDLGREGFAYKDSISANYHVSTGKKRQNWNNGRYYRNDGVDIFKKENATAYDDVYVGDLEIGDWMQYTFTANDAGNYMLAIRVSSQDTLGRAIIEINGVKLETLEIPSTAGEWKWINLNTIPLKKETNQLRFIAVESGFNLEAIRLQKQ